MARIEAVEKWQRDYEEAKKQELRAKIDGLILNAAANKATSRLSQVPYDCQSINRTAILKW